MSSKNRSKAQAARDRRNLRKLRDSGLISARTDIRKVPTRAQKATLTRYADVLKNKATVVKPKNPKAYGAFKRGRGGRVVVPREKGEKIRVNRSGEIESVKRVRGGKLRRRHIVGRSEIRQQIEKGQGRQIIAVPFKGKKKGSIRWRRFTRENWENFVHGNSIRATEEDIKKWESQIVLEQYDVDEYISLEDEMMGEEISESDIRRKRKPRR